MRARLSEDELKSEFRVQNQELRTEIELLFGPRRPKRPTKEIINQDLPESRIFTLPLERSGFGPG